MENLIGWCERGESNPYGCPLDPKSSASASSATLATPVVFEDAVTMITLRRGAFEEAITVSD
jgi:hypothetical protein